MRYVMVPVPSEFVMDVLRLVVFRGSEEESDLLGEAIRLESLLERSEPLARSLIKVVASGTLAGNPVRFSDVVDVLETDAPTLTALIATINRGALGGGRELIGTSTEIARRVHGNIGRNKHLVMRPEHAQLLRSLTRSDVDGGGMALRPPTLP